MTHEEMANELRKAGWHVKGPVDQTTCPHHSRRGTGWCGSDGSGVGDYYCPDCGKSWHEEHGPMPGAFDFVQQQPRN